MEIVSNPLSYIDSWQANKPVNQLSSLWVIQTASNMTTSSVSEQATIHNEGQTKTKQLTL